MKKPGILLGALVGGLLTLPLLALFYRRRADRGLSVCSLHGVQHRA